MEGVLGALVFLAIAACCGLPILLLGVARLFNRNKNRQEEDARDRRFGSTHAGSKGKVGGRGWRR